MKRQDQAFVILLESLQRSKMFSTDADVHGLLSVQAVMVVLRCSRSTASRVIDYIACHAERDGLTFGRLFWFEYIGGGRKVLRWSTRALHQWFRYDVSEHVFARYDAIKREYHSQILPLEELDFREMMGWLSNE